MMATVEQHVRIEPGSSEDIDAVMAVMETAFGDRFGEAWTRSQLGGILPMAGVSLVLARDADRGEAIGFSLFRTVADEAELLLIAVAPEQQKRGVGKGFNPAQQSGGVGGNGSIAEADGQRRCQQHQQPPARCG